MALGAGVRLGPYEIVGLLGAGGMGEVYRARDPRLGREVAVKVLPEEVARDPERLARFEREAHAIAALNHPNILTVFDVGTHDDVPYVVTELLEGETLRAMVSGRAPTQRQLLFFLAQAAHGLEAAHAKGIVHRDVKPENLFVTAEARVKLLDFGLAKPLDRASAASGAATESAPTGAGQLVGTIGYMSPEQVRGLPVDHRTDLFSFGVVAYEVLGGRHPFRRETTAGTLAAILEEEPAELTALGRGVPAALSGIVQRCLAKGREERFRSAHDLALSLESVLAAPAGAASLDEVELQSPYPGLASFTEKDAAFFFGREAEAKALWQRLRSRHLSGVIGPSGAGKTSFVRAGIVASRPEGWGTLVSTPGASPLRGLGQALGPELAGNPDALRRLAGFDDPETAFELVRGWRKGCGEALLVVDQFEELFTLNPKETQQRFAALLGRLAREADVHVLLSLRDDFLMKCADHEALARVFESLSPLSALSTESLRRALVEPARKRGYRFEDDALVEEMVESVEGARAALPLLAFAVSRLWERRDRERKLLTRAAYEEIGGVAGALAQHAEAVMDRIGTGQGTAREIFRNLVTAQGTRAVVDREELLSAFPQRKAAEEVLRELVDARLLTSFEVEGREGEPSRHRIEVAHESLLKAWPRLVRWQMQDEEGAVLRDQLKQAAHLWEERGRTSDLLWTGTAFQEYELWRGRYPGALTALEEDFARAMAEKARRRRRLVRAAVATAFTVLAAVAVAIGISRQQASLARDEARAQARRAEASRLLTLGRLRFEEDPTEALAHATASLDLADTPEARLFALRVLQTAPMALDVVIEKGDGRFPMFSPGGGRLAAAGHGENVFVWSADGKGPVGLPGHETSPQGPNSGFWASDDTLVSGLCCGLGSRVHVWVLPEGRRVRTIDFGAPSSWEVGPDRLFAATPTAGASRPRRLLRSWRLPDGDAEPLGETDTTVAFEPQGRAVLFTRGDTVLWRPLPLAPGPDRVLAVQRKGVRVNGGSFISSVDDAETRLWPTDEWPPGPPRVIPRPPDTPLGVFPDPSGRWLVAPPGDRTEVRLWDTTALPGARPLVLRRSGRWYGSVATVHPRGEWAVASTAALTHVTFWPLNGRYARVVDGYSGLVRPLAFSPDSRWLATTWAATDSERDRTIHLFPVPGGGESAPRTLRLPRQGLWTDLKFDPRGRFIFAVGNGDMAALVPLDGSPARKLEAFSDTTLLSWAAVSPSGQHVATAFLYGKGDKSLRVWDTVTGGLRRFPLPPPVASAAGSATGYESGVQMLGFVDETTLITAGWEGVRRWNTATGAHETVLASAAGTIAHLMMSGDGRTVLIRSFPANEPKAMTHRLWDVPSGKMRPLAGISPPGVAALDAAGTTLAWEDEGGVVHLTRLADGVSQSLVGHEGAVSMVAFSPDGKWVASAGEDNTLRLWPRPDLSKPGPESLPREELLAKLRSLTNIRVVRAPDTPDGWKLETGPFPGWKDVPTW